MSVLMDLLPAVSVVVVGAIVLIWRGSKPFLTGAAWSTLPIYGAALPEGWGLGCCLILLAILAAPARRKIGQVDRRVVRGGIALLSLAIWVALYERLSPPQVPGVSLTVVAGMGIAVVLAIASLSKDAAPLRAGLAAGGLILAVAEIARVLGGGQVHAPEAAFGVNPIVLAQYAAMSCLLALELLPRFRGLRRAGLSAWAVASFGGVVASGSRGPLIGLIVGLILLFVLGRSRSFRPFRAVVRASLVGFAVLVAWLLSDTFAHALAEFFRAEDADSNGAARVVLWHGAWATITQSPLLGAGPGRFFMSGYGPQHGLSEYPHNLFLELWSEYGLVAMFLFILGVAFAMRAGGRASAPMVTTLVVAFSFSGSLRSALILWVAIGVSATRRRSAEMDASPKLAGEHAAMALPQVTPQHTRLL